MKPTVDIAPIFRRANNGAAVSGPERLILREVLRGQTVSQSEIIKRTGMPQQTVSRLVTGLIERGLLQHGARVTSGRRGQPGITLQLVPEYAFSFGVSIMVDAVAVALLDFQGNVLAEDEVNLAAMTHDRVVAELKRMFRKLCDEQLRHDQRLLGIGVAISGYFLDDSNTMNTPYMLEEWNMIDLEQVLSEDFGLPVWIENDGTAAAIGEKMMGVGRWTDDFVYLYIATGLGGGVILNGEPARGRHRNAGEVAEILPRGIYPHPNLELLRQQLAMNGVETSSVQDMKQRFDINWPGVDEWIAKTRDSLSLIATASSALLDPEAVVLGGRIPKELAKELTGHVVVHRQARRSKQRPAPKIVVAEATGEAAAIGAAALPFNAIFFAKE